MSFPQGLPRPELRGHIPPGGTRAEPPRDRLQHLPVITPPPPPAALIRGQHRLDQLPQLISDHTSSDHSPIIGGATRDLWETRPRGSCCWGPPPGLACLGGVAVCSRGVLA